MTEETWKELEEEVELDQFKGQSYCLVCGVTLIHTELPLKYKDIHNYHPAEEDHINSEEHKENRILVKLAGERHDR